jgi:transposase
VDSNEQVVGMGRRRRRRHSAIFKAEVIGACQQPGVSLAAVALSHGLNANLLRRWVLQAERSGEPIAIRTSRPRVAVDDVPEFMPVTLSREPQSGIRIEVQHGSKKVTVHWPASAAHECARLLRALLK